MNVITTENVANKAALTIGTILSKLTQTQEKVTFGVCGGRSAQAVFEELQKQHLNWKKIHVFLIDERKVPITDEQRNDLIARKYLKPIHLHQYQSTEQYNFELHKQGGFFDIIFASMGEDGHIASLFPNHDSIKNEELFYIDVEQSPKPPEKRVSASRKLLLHSKHGVLVVSGNAKKEAFAQFLEKKDITQIPAILFHYLESSTVITNIEVNQ